MPFGALLNPNGATDDPQGRQKRDQPGSGEGHRLSRLWQARGGRGAEVVRLLEAQAILTPAALASRPEG